MLARLVEQPCIGSIMHSFREITASIVPVTEHLFILLLTLPYTQKRWPKMIASFSLPMTDLFCHGYVNESCRSSLGSSGKRGLLYLLKRKPITGHCPVCKWSLKLWQPSYIHEERHHQTPE